MKVTVLAERYKFSLIFKPIDALPNFPDLSQVVAAPFSPIYPFICYITFPGFPFILENE